MGLNVGVWAHRFGAECVAFGVRDLGLDVRGLRLEIWGWTRGVGALKFGAEHGVFGSRLWTSELGLRTLGPNTRALGLTDLGPNTWDLNFLIWRAPWPPNSPNFPPPSIFLPPHFAAGSPFPGAPRPLATNRGGGTLLGSCPPSPFPPGGAQPSPFHRNRAPPLVPFSATPPPETAALASGIGGGTRPARGAAPLGAPGLCSRPPPSSK